MQTKKKQKSEKVGLQHSVCLAVEMLAFIGGITWIIWPALFSREGAILWLPVLGVGIVTLCTLAILLLAIFGFDICEGADTKWPVRQGTDTIKYPSYDSLQ